MRAIGFVLICTVLLSVLVGCVRRLEPSLGGEISVSVSIESSVPADPATEVPTAPPTEAPTAEVTAPVTTADPNGFPNVPDDGHSKIY